MFFSFWAFQSLITVHFTEFHEQISKRVGFEDVDRKSFTICQVITYINRNGLPSESNQEIWPFVIQNLVLKD